MSQEGTPTSRSESAPRRKVIGRPFVKGQPSANPGGRPKLEPRIRRRARRYDSRVVAELFKIGTDPKVDADTRRKCLMDLQAIGNGKPVTSQEVVRPEPPQGPLVAFNFGQQQTGHQLTPEAAYRLMVEGQLPEGANHPAFQRRVIEAAPAPASPTPEAIQGSTAAKASNAAVEGITDKRVSPRASDSVQAWIAASTGCTSRAQPDARVTDAEDPL